MTDSGEGGQRPGRGAPLPRLHVVTDDSVLARGGWEASAAEVLEAGGPAVALHIRGPHTDGATLYGLASVLLPHARRAGACLFVNDRVDVALLVDVDGVHLGQRSLPLPAARRLLGPGRRLGASFHDAEDAAEAGAEGADYAFLGTIFETPTHTGFPGMGLERLEEVVRRLRGLAVVGIGGIDLARVPSVLAAGVYGVAAVRGVWDERDPASAVGRYLAAIQNGRERA